MIQGFRFNNPKQCSNWIILVSFCSSHFAIKNCYNVHFMKIEKIGAKIDFSAKNSKKFVYYNEELVHKFKFQTQLSRKLQRFRTCRKNKKCSIFHDLSEYIIFSYGCKLLDWSFKIVYYKKIRILTQNNNKFFATFIKKKHLATLGIPLKRKFQSFMLPCLPRSCIMI